MSAVVWRNPGIRIEPRYDQFSGAKLYGNTVDMLPGTEEDRGRTDFREWKYQCDASLMVCGEMNGYVAPSMDQMQIPEDVSGRTGFYSRAAGRTADSGSGSTESEGNIRFRRNGRGAVIFRRGYPYYQMLSENQQSVYRQIYANAQNLTEKFAPEKDRVCQ